jgi:hypothetical protein
MAPDWGVDNMSYLVHIKIILTLASMAGIYLMLSALRPESNPQQREEDGDE